MSCFSYNFEKNTLGLQKRLEVELASIPIILKRKLKKIIILKETNKGLTEIENQNWMRKK